MPIIEFQCLGALIVMECLEPKHGLEIEIFALPGMMGRFELNSPSVLVLPDELFN